MVGILVAVVLLIARSSAFFVLRWRICRLPCKLVLADLEIESVLPDGIDEVQKFFASVFCTLGEYVPLIIAGFNSNRLRSNCEFHSADCSTALSSLRST